MRIPRHQEVICHVQWFLVVFRFEDRISMEGNAVKGETGGENEILPMCC